jgi:hypothetical protein
MLEEELFMYSKLNTEDNHKLKRVISALSAYIDRTGWDGTVEQAFMTKFLRKLNNFRAEMLSSREITKRGDTYQIAPDGNAEPRVMEARAQIQRVYDSATEDEKNDLLIWFMALPTREKTLRAIKAWMSTQTF